MPERLVLLRLRRTGGFAGNLPPVVVEAPVLSPEQLGALERHADAAASAAPAAGRPDGFRYELEVERGGERRQLVFGDRGLPGELRSVLAELTRQARRPG